MPASRWHARARSRPAAPLGGGTAVSRAAQCAADRGARRAPARPRQSGRCRGAPTPPAARACPRAAPHRAPAVRSRAAPRS
eukprot:2391861-Prymnesium_polylepis.1